MRRSPPHSNTTTRWTGYPRSRTTSREHTLIAELAAASVDGIHLARELMSAQGVADDLERAAGFAVDRAASCPDDPHAADVAVSTAAAAADASDVELAASIKWAEHIAHVERLVHASSLCPDAGRR